MLTFEGNELALAIDELLNKLVAGLPEQEQVRKRLEERLEYNWKGKTEQTVDREFKDFNKEIDDALAAIERNKNLLQEQRDSLIDTIRRILGWGGINNTVDMKTHYADYLLLLEHLIKNAQFKVTPKRNRRNNKTKNENKQKQVKEFKAAPISLEDISADHNAFYPCYQRDKASLTPLASWTKVLAAYKPDKFCIYDSRVAISLRFLNILLPVDKRFARGDWYTPAPNKDDDTKNLQKGIGPGVNTEFATTTKYASACYQEYCNFINNQIINDRTIAPKYFEKRLFVLGGLLNDLYELKAMQKTNTCDYKNDKKTRLAKLLGWTEGEGDIGIFLKRELPGNTLVDNFNKLLCAVRADSLIRLRQNGYKPADKGYVAVLLGVPRLPNKANDKQKERFSNAIRNAFDYIVSLEGSNPALPANNNGNLDILRESLQKRVQDIQQYAPPEEFNYFDPNAKKGKK